MVKIIWVDDDSFGILSVLVQRLKRQGISVEKFKYYEDAEEYLKNNMNLPKSILIDFILPSREVRVSAFLGLKLAKIALEKKVQRITFLSVVDVTEVKLDLDELFKFEEVVGNDSNSSIGYNYFNKAEIVEQYKFLELIKSLKGNNGDSK